MTGYGVLLDVSNGVLVFAFGSGAVWSTSHGPDAPPSTEVSEDTVENDLSTSDIVAVDQSTSVVDEQLVGHSAKVQEGAFNTSKPVLTTLMGESLNVDTTAVAQGQDAKMDSGRDSGQQDVGGAEVGLELLARGGFKANGGLGFGAKEVAIRGDGALYSAQVNSDAMLLVEFLENNSSIAPVLVKGGFEPVLKAIEGATPVRGLESDRASVAYVSLDGVLTHAQFTGNTFDAPAQGMQAQHDLDIGGLFHGGVLQSSASGKLCQLFYELAFHLFLPGSPGGQISVSPGGQFFMSSDIKAKNEPDFRFYALYDKVYRKDILMFSYVKVRANAGSPGVDGLTFEMIEAQGLPKWLEGLQQELQTQSYKPDPVKRVNIPKPGGGSRPLGIPTVRDRVAQMAAKLLLEPIFEADFTDDAYGYRPKRSAQDAIHKVAYAVRGGHVDVVDADLSKYFDTIPHHELMQSVARRVSDGKMLNLVKKWLKTPIQEEDDQGRPRMGGGKAETKGVPQGGVISPLLANIYMQRMLRAWHMQG